MLTARQRQDSILFLQKSSKCQIRKSYSSFVEALKLIQPTYTLCPSSPAERKHGENLEFRPRALAKGCVWQMLVCSLLALTLLHADLAHCHQAWTPTKRFGLLPLPDPSALSYTLTPHNDNSVMTCPYGFGRLCHFSDHDSFCFFCITMFLTL